MEVEEAKEQEEASPPSPVPRLAPRRSSMATARRLSRASALGGGIPLQDLLATVPPAAEAAAGERLVKVATLCINAAVRQLEGAVYLDEGEEEAAREVGKALRGVAVEEEVLVRVAGCLGGGVEVGEGDGAGEARRAVLARTAAYKAEHKAWGALVKERRAEEARATAMAKEVARGRKRIGADHRYEILLSLPPTCPGSPCLGRSGSSWSGSRTARRPWSTSRATGRGWSRGPPWWPPAPRGSAGRSRRRRRSWRRSPGKSSPGQTR